MVRMAKFAKENPDLKPIPLIKAYNERYPEVTMKQKLANIRNWLGDNEVMAVAEADNECATLPLQRVSVPKGTVCCGTCYWNNDGMCDNDKVCEGDYNNWKQQTAL